MIDENTKIASYAGLIALLMLFVSAGLAQTFMIPDGKTDLVGEVFTVQIEGEETLLDIARKYDLGYNEIIAANPGIDPWLPGIGQSVVVPQQFILPSAPRIGIIINLSEMRLYYYPKNDQPTSGSDAEVMTFPLGVGIEGWSTPLGKLHIVEKIKDPAWTVPDSILAEYVKEGYPLNKVVPAGADNPLGAFALRLSNPSYLIHGTNQPYGVGRRISHGCLRMYPEDIEQLYTLVSEGVAVNIINQSYKAGVVNNKLYIEAHEPVVEDDQSLTIDPQKFASAVISVLPGEKQAAVEQQLNSILDQRSGIPEYIQVLGDPVQAALVVDMADGWHLQIGAFRLRDNALNLSARVEKLNIPVNVLARIDDGYCHVLTGPFEDKKTANEAARVLAETIGITGTLIPAGRHGNLATCQN
ncbi:MAG: L,D-transpeptidase family protein [Gammaproteobacteria bacterium]